MKRLFATVVAIVPALGLAGVTTYDIDPMHTQSSFSVRHMGVTNVRGEFRKTSGTVKLDDAAPSRSSVEATIEVATIDTRVDMRDDHLRSADFFDAAKFPTITFKSTRVEKAGQGYRVTGDLTMHGVTKPVVLEVTPLTPQVKDPMGAFRRGVAARATLSRRDFGLTWNKMIESGPVVGDEVKVEIEAELVKEPESKQAKN